MHASYFEKQIWELANKLINKTLRLYKFETKCLSA